MRSVTEEDWLEPWKVTYQRTKTHHFAGTSLRVMKASMRVDLLYRRDAPQARVLQDMTMAEAAPRENCRHCGLKTATSHEKLPGFRLCARSLP